MTRLSNAVLSTLPALVRRPGYDRTKITPGIVHLGIGAFHRAHQAAMTETVLATSPADSARDWGILGASLRSAETRDALTPQNGLYTLGIREGETTAWQVIGAIQDVLVAPEDPERLLAAMAAPTTRIVSLTVTEKGYCHDPASGALNESHPDVIHDLARPGAPRSAIGYLAKALHRRRAAGIPPFTVLCCDNLPANGKTVKRVLARFASLRDPAFGRFVTEEVACPSTMVDRIVPATTDADREAAAAALGVSDAWPVMTEPFLQWVIEDHFPSGRPNWEIAGAEFVADVAPYELMKLRMLNGAHSMLAYLGALAGHTYVADCAHDPLFARLLDTYWKTIAPTLPASAGDPADYARRLQTRFSNVSIRHRLIQIAMDGSQKLPQRQVAPLRELAAAGLPFEPLALAIAAFLAFMGGDGTGCAFEIRDPLAAEFAARAATDNKSGDNNVLARNLLGIEKVFGDLGAIPAILAAVSRYLDTLKTAGPRVAIEDILALR